ncbi:hypothetical protein [Virgibacillus oceani]|uniref:Uncharacterized protein n=1 Tax=Virgibacillus oceani TaxID=1479511 RepID=A0A917HHV8_9BACI|nr:hypothetical protein [Virgibacillus oceani]GGG79121.1 hypothetical protein GCM10011398_25530 [Virgibacillus oceani]
MDSIINAILNLIGSISTMIFASFKDITEEEIEKNIEYLNQEKWFQVYSSRGKLCNQDWFLILDFIFNTMKRGDVYEQEKIR